MKRNSEDILVDGLLNNFEEMSLIGSDGEYETLIKCYNYIWDENNEKENVRIIEMTKKRYKRYMIYLNLEMYEDLERSIYKFFQEDDIKKKYAYMKETDMIILSILRLERDNGKKHRCDY